MYTYSAEKNVFSKCLFGLFLLLKVVTDGLNEKLLKLHLLDVFFGPDDVPLGEGTREENSNVFCMLCLELV